MVFTSRLHAIMQASNLPVSHLLNFDPSVDAEGTTAGWASPAAASTTTATAAAVGGSHTSSSSMSSISYMHAAPYQPPSPPPPSHPHLQGLAVLLLLSPYHLAQRVEWLQLLLPHLAKEELFSILLLLGHITPQALHVRWQILQSAVRELPADTSSSTSDVMQPSIESRSSGSSGRASSDCSSSSSGIGRHSSWSSSSTAGIVLNAINGTTAISTDSTSSSTSSSSGADGGGAVGGTISSTTSSSSSWADQLQAARGSELASLLTAPHESLAQVTYLSTTQQQQQLGLMEALNSSKAEFVGLFPGYLDWLRHGPSVTGAR